MKTGITLLTMGQGNVIVLKKTLESFKNIVDEVIYGDTLIFEEDRKVLNSYVEEYNIKIVKLPFNYLFLNGFASMLNVLAEKSTNDMCIYMNTSEVIDEDFGILETIKNNSQYNTFCFNHRTDTHRWFRCYKKSELKWSGLIHEEVVGNIKPYSEPIFMMADIEKDIADPFYAKVMDSIKELVYFNQYLKLVDQPHLRGGTNIGWVQFAKDGHSSFVERLHAKGKMYDAFITGDFEMFMKEIFSPNAFNGQKFESSILLEYQQNPMFLNKK